MRTAAARPIEACLLDLLQHFGIERAHIAAGGPPPLKDWHSLATLHPERVASLTLISPPVLDTAPLAALASRILIVAGDRGSLADGAAKFANSLPSVSAHVLRGYEWLPWSDVIADRGAEIGAAMLDFLDRHPLPAVRFSEPEGEVGGITVVAFWKAAPERQLMLMLVFVLSALKRSKNRPARARPPNRTCFSTRKSTTLTFSWRRVPMGSTSRICDAL